MCRSQQQHSVRVRWGRERGGAHSRSYTEPQRGLSRDECMTIRISDGRRRRRKSQLWQHTGRVVATTALHLDGATPKKKKRGTCAHRSTIADSQNARQCTPSIGYNQGNSHSKLGQVVPCTHPIPSIPAAAPRPDNIKPPSPPIQPQTNTARPPPPAW